MRFQNAETAFFFFVALISVAGALLCAAYLEIHAHALRHSLAGGVPDLSTYGRLLLASGALLAMAIAFGAFFIYPLLRAQTREERRLRNMTASLSARSESLRQAALTDSLTGAHNRRFFDEALREYLREFTRIGKPVGLLLLDLDHFKQVNDSHGHDVGDEVLREVARCLREMTHYHDVVARLGGEEFAVVAANLNHETLLRIAERIRNAVASLIIEGEGLRLRITTSVGLAVWDGKETAEAFYRRADRMLYQAKRLGRNRVCA